MSTIITKRQFPHYHKYTMDLAGRPLTLEVGKLAELANAAVMVGYGDTRVLCCVTAAARPRDGIDFFPLSVDFEEKLYAVGRIPGSFNRREGRPGEKGVLTSRVIDRPIRPLFPHDFRNDVYDLLPNRTHVPVYKSGHLSYQTVPSGTDLHLHVYNML